MLHGTHTSIHHEDKPIYKVLITKEKTPDVMLKNYTKFFKYVDCYRHGFTYFAVNNTKIKEPLKISDFTASGFYVHAKNSIPISNSGKKIHLKKFKIITRNNNLIYLLE